MRYESQAERLRIRRELADARADLRCASVPYPDVSRFGVQTYADVNSGMIKLLKNASYLLDELYLRIPTRFEFYTRTQEYKDTDGVDKPAGEWYMQEDAVVPKRTTVDPPEADPMWCYDFDGWSLSSDRLCAVDFGTAYGPLSAYAFYGKKKFSVGFTDLMGNRLELPDSIESGLSAVSAFSDIKDAVEGQQDDIITALQAQNEKYHRETYQYYYLYGFGGGYPGVLSNVTRNMVFDSQYAYLSTPPYVVYDHISEYDGENHVPSVQINAPGHYAIGYSGSKDGPFTSVLTDGQNSFKYTANQVCAVYFQISSYSAIFDEYKRCSETDVGYVRIWKSHLLQEENRHAVMTEQYTEDGKVSVLVNGAVTLPQTSRVGGGQQLPADPTPGQEGPDTPTPRPVDPTITYRIEFKPGQHGTRTGGGELVQNVEVGKSASLPTITAASKWKFEGWDSKKWQDVSEDATINAVYSEVPPGKFKVTFELGPNGKRTGGGELIQEVEEGNSAAAPEVVGINRYVFKGWDREDWTEVMAEMVVTAQYNDPLPAGDAGLLLRFAEGTTTADMDFSLASGKTSVTVGEHE